MKARLLYLFLFIQVAVLTAMYAWHQIALNTRPVLLRTELVDPRDLLRGDYIILQYEAGKLPEKMKKTPDGEVLYVILKPDGKFFTADYVNSVPPQDGSLFIRGTVRQDRLDFGIGNYFVPEGQGNPRGKISVLVSVRSDGRAQIKQLYVDNAPWPGMSK